MWVRKSGNMISIFRNYQLIRKYTIPKRHFAYDPKDFPEIVREMIDGGYPKYLLEQAECLGQSSYELIKQILIPHAYLNLRRAQGILNVMKDFQDKEYFHYLCEKAIHYKINKPKEFREMMESEENQMQLDFEKIEVSETGKQMIRDIRYYLS